MKKTILVPTDFSANAQTALSYAIGLAKAYGYGLQLTHSYAPLPTRFTDQEFQYTVDESAKAEAEKKLQALHQQVLEQHPELNVVSGCVEGNNVADTLISIAGKASHQLIVMGTKGASGLRQILGSNTYQTITNSPIPVLAIPETVSEFKLERAGLLSNFKKSDIPLLEMFFSIFGKRIQISVLHVRETSSSQEETELIQWKNLLQDHFHLNNMQWIIDTVSNRLDVKEDTAQCIHDMAEENELQALLISHNARNFFQRIFSKNLTRNIAHEIHRPVFFYRES